jgi:3-phenylpropionate/trans-cinnamate dioxygenase ferredoxin reductase subunit
MTDRVLIIGAGHAGATAAAMLRRDGFEGAIVLAGEEPQIPYQRPPLSKAWLKGEADSESLALHPESFYAENRIDLRLGLSATEIRRSDQTVLFSNGEPEDYGALIIATGASARQVNCPGADLDGVLSLRNAADADALKARLTPGAKLAVVGGGYIGLEVAASARALGCEVTVIEREERVLARVAAAPLSAFFQRYHTARGVHILTGVAVEGFEGQGAVSGVKLAGGKVIACDVVLVGVGAAPNIALARDCGLACADGVIVDEAARTSDPRVFAIGDVTHRPLPLYGRNMRLESVPNALEQAKQAAAAITGHAPPPPEVPWFWSDQFDLKLQIAGVPFDSDSLVIRGEPDDDAFAVFHLHGARVMAVEAVGAAAEFMGGRLLIGKKAEVDPARLGDMGVSMKELARG